MPTFQFETAASVRAHRTPGDDWSARDRHETTSSVGRTDAQGMIQPVGSQQALRDLSADEMSSPGESSITNSFALATLTDPTHEMSTVAGHGPIAEEVGSVPPLVEPGAHIRGDR